MITIKADDTHVFIEYYFLGGKEETILNHNFVDDWKPYSEIESELSKFETQIKIGKIFVK
jgi:hypothetical protein